MAHPKLATISCETCQRFVHDDQWNVVKRGGLPIVRPDPKATPCWKCPKGSPANEKDNTLSLRNLRLIWAYKKIRATNGCCLTKHERRDGMLLKNLAIIDSIMRIHDTQRTGETVANALASLPVTRPAGPPAVPAPRGRR